MGPLAGIKIIEIAGIGPGPFCGMLLADLGADVILVERTARNSEIPDHDTLGAGAIFNRGKRSICLDLKNARAIEVVLDMLAGADALIEGFRPGVMERLGLGPDVCLDRNPRLVYGRMTGWGQSGPLSQAAGHDINYIALSGALFYAGRPGEAPSAPATVIGDAGGGGLLLALGIVSALFHARQSGQGQVVDAAIVEGSALLTSLLHVFHNIGEIGDKRGGGGFADGVAPWYDVYECSDGHCISVGAIEPKFYQTLVEKCGLDDDPDFATQFDKRHWPAAKATMTRLFKTRTRDQWCDVLQGTDACFAPVLSIGGALEHEHNQERQVFVEIEGVTQPAPAPRFSATPATIRSSPPEPGAHSESILSDAGFTDDRIDKLRQAGVI